MSHDIIQAAGTAVSAEAGGRCNCSACRCCRNGRFTGKEAVATVSLDTKFPAPATGVHEALLHEIPSVRSARIWGLGSHQQHCFPHLCRAAKVQASSSSLSGDSGDAEEPDIFGGMDIDEAKPAPIQVILAPLAACQHGLCEIAATGGTPIIPSHHCRRCAGVAGQGFGSLKPISGRP